MKSILFVSAYSDVLNGNRGVDERVRNLVEHAAEYYDTTLIEPTSAGSTDEGSVNYKIVRFPLRTPVNLVDLNPQLYLTLRYVIPDTQPDLIQAEGCGGVTATALTSKLLRYDCPLIYDAHNVEAIRVKQQGSPDVSRLKRLAAPYVIPKVEASSVRAADHILTVSDDDRRIFKEKYDVSPSSVSTVPSGGERVSTDSLKDPETVRARHGLSSNDVSVVFHGTYSYYPNKEAMEIIEKRIAPSFTHTNVEFLLAGNGAPESASDNVTYLGFVEDLPSLLNACDIAAVPLCRGGGTKLKMFDYMSLGLPIITTKKGAEGIDLNSGEDALITNHPDDQFISKLEELVCDDQLQEKLGKNANSVFANQYTWEAIGTKYNHLVGEIGDSYNEY